MADNLDAIPGYTELNNQLSAALAKEALLNEQKLAARENGDIAAARQYAEQLAGLKDQQAIINSVHLLVMCTSF